MEFTKTDLYKIKEELTSELLKELAEEADSFGFDGSGEDNDIFDTPSVDSKSVVKLSPIVEKYTGKKIEPGWIKPGGYDSTAEAVEHLVEQLELSLE